MEYLLHFLYKICQNKLDKLDHAVLGYEKFPNASCWIRAVVYLVQHPFSHST